MQSDLSDTSRNKHNSIILDIQVSNKQKTEQHLCRLEIKSILYFETYFERDENYKSERIFMISLFTISNKFIHFFVNKFTHFPCVLRYTINSDNTIDPFKLEKYSSSLVLYELT